MQRLRTNGNGCPVCECGTGRYIVSGDAPVAGIAPRSLTGVA
ncbi:MAG: hypothetical protein WBS17_07755 [Candidatus Acidiferrales bacterium]